MLIAVMGVSSCTTTPPSNVDNLCDIFREKSSWHKAAKKSHRKWGVPEPVLMAIMHQESTFNAKVRPKRTKILWVIPWKRPSSAYGYAQVLDSTWDWYRKDTGKSRAKRSNFSDAVDFIGWYCAKANKDAGISKTNARHLYLAYHEGIGGYKRRTYQSKRWLLNVAGRVDRRAQTYTAQYNKCKSTLRPRFRLWPF